AKGFLWARTSAVVDLSGAWKSSFLTIRWIDRLAGPQVGRKPIWQSDNGLEFKNR
ncbi:unnamed protein product, partial [Discosporangium mesarthrocarpum]